MWLAQAKHKPTPDRDIWASELPKYPFKSLPLSHRDLRAPQANPPFSPLRRLPAMVTTRVWGLGFEIQVLGFKVEGLGFRVLGKAILPATTRLGRHTLANLHKQLVR